MALTARAVPRLKPEALKQVAKELYLGRWYPYRDEEDLRTAGILLGLCGGTTDAFVERCSLILGDNDSRVGALGINGRPVHTAWKFVHTKDVDALWAQVDAIAAAVDEA